MKENHQNASVGHRFAIGNTVQISKVVPLRNAASGLYEILARLPERDGEFQYRIKSQREPYQRIIKEDELELPQAPRYQQAIKRDFRQQSG